MSQASAALPAVLWLYVGADGMQVALHDGQWRDDSVRSIAINAAAGAPLSDAFALLMTDASWIALASQAREMRAFVSDHWLASACVPWSQEQLQPARALRDAAGHLAAAGLDVGPADEIRLDDTAAGGPRLAIAWPAALLDSLQAAAGTLEIRRVEARSLGVELAARLARAEGSPELAALIEPGDSATHQATLIRMKPRTQRVEQIATRRVRDIDESPWQVLAQSLGRLGWMDDVPATCAVLDGRKETVETDTATPPSGWTPIAWQAEPGTDTDTGAGRIAHGAWLRWLVTGARRIAGPLDVAFGRDRRVIGKFRTVVPGPRVRPVHLVACVVMMATAVWLANRAGIDWRKTAALQAARSVAAAPREVPAVPPTKEKLERLAAVNLAISHLNIPLAGVMQALQPPRDIRVGLLGLEVSASKASAGEARPAVPILRIQAESPTVTDMTLYVAYLAGRKPLTHTQLLRHETQADTTYRFAVEVGWQP